MIPVIPNMTELKRIDIRARIAALEKTMLQMEQQEIEIQHHFSGGIYKRSMFAPAGSMIIGKIYRKAHYIVMPQGCVSVTTETAGTRYFQAPAMWPAPAGDKRAIQVHSNTVWCVLIATDKTTPEEAMAEVTVASFEDLEDVCRPS